MAYIESIPEAEESVAAVMRRYPDQAMPMMQFSESILRTGRCQFSNEQRELIGAYASGLNSCTYCYGTHKATAEAFGVEPGLLDGMLEDLESADVEPTLLPVLRFVRKLTRTPSRIGQADVDAIFAAGWDEDSFHHAVMICALFNMMNRIMDGYGVRNSEAFRDARGRMLAETGYLPFATGGEPRGTRRD